MMRRPPSSTLFPTRRSSDLLGLPARHGARLARCRANRGDGSSIAALDRKSTRLNSSHVKISYAVFCLKKKMMSVQHEHRTVHEARAVKGLPQHESDAFGIGG